MENELPTEAGVYWWRKDDDDEWVHRIVIAQGPRIIMIRPLSGYTGEQIVKVWLLSKIQDAPAYGQWLRIPGPDEIMEMQATGCQQRTICGGCGEYAHTPLRRDELGGYICLRCIEARLNEIARFYEAFKIQSGYCNHSDFCESKMHALGDCTCGYVDAVTRISDALLNTELEATDDN